MKKCSNCGASLEGATKFCPECGAAVPVNADVVEGEATTNASPKTKKRFPLWLWGVIAGAALVVVVVGALVFNSLSAKPFSGTWYAISDGAATKVVMTDVEWK